jgi:hypothetical protein
MACGLTACSLTFVILEAHLSMEKAVHDAVHGSPCFHDSLGGHGGNYNSVFLNYLLMFCGSTFYNKIMSQGSLALTVYDQMKMG